MKKYTVVLAMVLALLAMFSVKTTNVFAGQSTVMWVEDVPPYIPKVCVYEDPFANVAGTPQLFFIRSDDGFYLNASAKTWGEKFWLNCDISQKGKREYLINNEELTYPNGFTRQSYTTTWGQGIVGIGSGHIKGIMWYHYLLLFLVGKINTVTCAWSGITPVITTTTTIMTPATTTICQPATTTTVVSPATTTTIVSPVTTTTVVTPVTTTTVATCPLVSINNAVVQLLDGYMINGQLNFNTTWYDQFPNAQNQVTLNCTYSGEWLEFSVCTETDTDYCPEPCDNQYRTNTADQNHHNWHYGYLCP